MILPVDWLNRPDAPRLATAYRGDLQAIARILGVRPPVYVVVTGMETEPGFLEFARRMTEAFRTQEAMRILPSRRPSRYCWCRPRWPGLVFRLVRDLDASSHGERAGQPRRQQRPVTLSAPTSAASAANCPSCSRRRSRRPRGEKKSRCTAAISPRPGPRPTPWPAPPELSAGECWIMPLPHAGPRGRSSKTSAYRRAATGSRLDRRVGRTLGMGLYRPGHRLPQLARPGDARGPGHGVDRHAAASALEAAIASGRACSHAICRPGRSVNEPETT